MGTPGTRIMRHVVDLSLPRCNQIRTNDKALDGLVVEVYGGSGSSPSSSYTKLVN